jgi:hypothetical protein
MISFGKGSIFQEKINGQLLAFGAQKIAARAYYMKIVEEVSGY